jgi:hypothetical protein
MRDEVGETFDSHAIAVTKDGLDGFGERGNPRH